MLYRRIFPTLAFKKSTLIVGSAVILWFVVALFTDIFQCRPFQAAFDPKLLFTNRCINLKTYYRGVTASNLCIDVAILYMPLAYGVGVEASHGTESRFVRHLPPWWHVSYLVVPVETS